MANDSSKDVFRDLIDDIDRQAGRWTAFFAGLESAYEAAYNAQAKLLSNTKANIDAQKKREQEERTFILSMFTAGLGSPMATHFSKELKATAIKNLPDIAKAAGGDKIIDDMVGHTISALKTAGGVLNGASKNIQDWVLKSSGIKSADTSAEPFVPAGLTGTQYGANLRQGCQERVNLLKDIVFVFRDTADGFPVPAAKAIREAFAKTDFFTKAPPSKMDDKTRALLASRAKLALWIAWALGRDRTYWTVQSGMRLYGPAMSEVFAWEDLRKELVLLGVPAGSISFPESRHTGWAASRAMNMEGFIRWASSPNSLQLLFSGLQTDTAGVRSVVGRWNSKVKVQ